MDEIPISKFKATCAAVVDDVARTGRSITITKRGKPIAEVVPPAPRAAAPRRLGTMAGEIEFVGDTGAPTGTFDETEMLREWDELNSDEDSPRYAHLDLECEQGTKARTPGRSRTRKPTK